MKATQTGILWSQVQVLVGPPEKQALIRKGEGFVFLSVTLSNAGGAKKCVGKITAHFYSSSTPEPFISKVNKPKQINVATT